MQGPESDYARGEEVAKVIWAPVMRSHRVTVEQMAILEPGLSETLCASLLDVMREALDEVARRGVPREAARDFLLGHMNVLGAVIFEETQGVFSDACNKAIQFGKPVLMRDDWKRIFEPDEIAASIRADYLKNQIHQKGGNQMTKFHAPLRLSPSGPACSRSDLRLRPRPPT